MILQFQKPILLHGMFTISSMPGLLSYNIWLPLFFYHLSYSKMLKEFPSIFSVEGDATLHDSCLDTTFFVSSVQNRCGRDRFFLFSRNGSTDIQSYRTLCVQSNMHLPIKAHLDFQFPSPKSATDPISTLWNRWPVWFQQIENFLLKSDRWPILNLKTLKL